MPSSASARHRDARDDERHLHCDGGGERIGDIEREDVFRAMLLRHAARECGQHCLAHEAGVVFDERVRQPDRDAFLAADHRPDEAPVARIEFFDARFLLDHFRAIHA